MKNIIEIKGLCKSFKDVKAVQDLSFCVREGELFAFLGVNGAGKSTTISILCGILSKDRGQVCVDGVDIDKNPLLAKQGLGVVFQNSVLDKALTVRDNLESRAALYGIFDKEFEKRLEELSELLDFKDLLSRTVGKLSGGQRRRLFHIMRGQKYRHILLLLQIGYDVPQEFSRLRIEPRRRLV